MQFTKGQLNGVKGRLYWITLLFLIYLSGSCQHTESTEPAETRLAKSLVRGWNQIFLELERHTPGYRAPVSARTFAYVSSAAYQASLPYLPGSISLGKYFTDFHPFVDPPGKFYLPASLNAAYAEIMRDFFPTAPPYLLERINLFEAEQSAQLRTGTDPTTYRLSANYGKRTAFTVWRWAATDSIGQNGFLHNEDSSFQLRHCTGCWQPDDDHPAQALLPQWGQVRSFIVPNSEITVKAPVPYDEHPGSQFYAGAMEVYSISNPLGKENGWIAEFWSDDVPGLTVTPTGRWISIANQAVEKSNPDFPRILEMYVKLGYAISDALVTCWEAKFRFNLDRPTRYIRRNIRPGWKPVHPNPPFPSYPSGHAAIAAAASTVLGEVFGKDFAFTDRTHEDRLEFEGKPRTYPSFSAMAEENALSRIVMGVHYRMDCEEGSRIGRIIGQKVVELPLFNADVSALGH